MAHINGKAAQEYFARFGADPNSKDPSAELVRWQEMCQALIDERDRLRDDLADTRKMLRDANKAITSLLPPMDEETKRLANLPLEEPLAMCDKEQSIEDFLAELDRSIDNHG